jgi:Homeodomain-like domain
MIQDGKLRGFAMGHAIPVRTDYTAGEVRRFAQRAKDAAQARRLLAIAAVLEGASREEAAKIGGMDRQTLRDWDPVQRAGSGRSHQYSFSGDAAQAQRYS